MGRHNNPVTAKSTEDPGIPSAASVTQSTDPAAEPADSTDSAGPADPAGPTKKRRRLYRPGWRTLTACASLLIIAASAAATVHMRSYSADSDQERQRADEYAAFAEQSTINLMSLNSETARDDLQRAIDDTTGAFMASMLFNSEDFVKTMQEAKISTKVTIESTAVDSMTDDAAVVLVAARSEVTNADGPPRPPQLLRLVMDLQRVGSEIKVAKVVPVP